MIEQETKNRKITLYKGVCNLEVNILEYNSEFVRYKVNNTPICQFDQHSRARIGVKFLDYKVDEDPNYVLYSFVYDKIHGDDELRKKVFKTLDNLEDLRQSSAFKDQYNLMSRNCSYIVEQTYQSLMGQMSRRLKLCEEQFIVGLHWKLRDMLINLGVDQAKDFLPGCDRIQHCDYSQADYLSNMFGCLFANCGRWPANTNYATFNFSCSTIENLEDELNIQIPKSKHELENEKN